MYVENETFSWNVLNPHAVSYIQRYDILHQLHSYDSFFLPASRYRFFILFINNFIPRLFLPSVRHNHSKEK